MTLRGWLGLPLYLLGMTIVHIGILIAVGQSETRRFWDNFFAMLEEM